MSAGTTRTRPRPRRIRRVIWLTVLALFVGYLIWIGFQTITFRTYLTGRWALWSEIEGVYHVHSRFSDGWASVPEIAAVASQINLDFLILTDHGSPNRKSLASQGWHDGVLVLAGSELSSSRGHLVGLGFEPEQDPIPRDADEAVQEINRRGGLAVIAHPSGKPRWSWGPLEGYHGLEVLNGNTLLRKNFLLSLPYLPALPFKPVLGLIKMTDGINRDLAYWDMLNREHRLYGYFGSDAHLFYRATLSFLHIHIYLGEPFSRDFRTARGQVLQALRHGKFYNAIDAAAQARGFRFWGEKKGRRIPMGRETVFEHPCFLRVKAPFDFAIEIRILKDGQVVLSSRKTEVVYEVGGPGVYRAEVYLRARTPLPARTPWIISNPIFFREALP
jgi:hypothetical protein